MSNKYKFHNPDGIYFMTHTVVEWVDVFTRSIYKDILINSWKYCQHHKGLLIHTYVVMTNNVQMIISRDSHVLLESVMRDMKKFTSQKILKAIRQEPESRRNWMLNIFQQAGSENSNNTKYQLWK